MKDTIQKTLFDIAGLLREREISFAFIGGIAVIFRGEPRFTADVDAVLDLDVPAALGFLESLDPLSFRPLFPDVHDVVRTSFLLPLRHVKTKIRVDLALGRSGFEQQLIARATDVDVAGITVPVATAEDLVLLKMIAGRPRDTDDTHRIVARQADQLDWEYLLETGAQLQRALGQDIVPPLQRLRRSCG